MDSMWGSLCVCVCVCVCVCESPADPKTQRLGPVPGGEWQVVGCSLI